MEKTFYISKEQFNAVTAAWKNSKDHTAAEHIVYNVLRNKPVDNGFTEKHKNIQGCDSWYGFNQALSNARWMCKLQNDSKKQHFKQRFGIDMPEDIVSKFEGVQK
jgi:hypothetical protein